jgi:hypothetical protein
VYVSASEGLWVSVRLCDCYRRLAAGVEGTKRTNEVKGQAGGAHDGLDPRLERREAARQQHRQAPTMPTRPPHRIHLHRRITRPRRERECL